MMLHRHFEEERKRENMTTLADVTPTVAPEPEATEDVTPTVAPEPETRKVGRPRKES